MTKEEKIKKIEEEEKFLLDSIKEIVILFGAEIIKKEEVKKIFS